MKREKRNHKIWYLGMSVVACTSAGLLLSLPKKADNYDVEKVRSTILEANPGLEAVLKMYEGDSLKHAAALFLIDNLGYHTGVDSADMRGLYTAYGLFATGRYSYQQAMDSAFSLYGTSGVRKVSWKKDTYIDPGYLVRNIEWAFKVWREQPWGKNISFAQFCEYILPYRVGNEKLEPWREKLYYEFMPAIERHLDDPRIEDPAYAADILLDSLFKSPYRFTGQMGSEVHIGPQIVEWKSGSCLDLCHMAVYVFRALGIPCGVEELPLRGDNNVAHYWNFFVDPHGKTWWFSLFYWRQRLGKPEDYGDVYGKVFRQRFSLNRSLAESIPGTPGSRHPRFGYPCFEDVTKVYAGKKTFAVRVPDSRLTVPVEKGNPLYLCMSTRLEWKPVACIAYDGREACFPDCHGGTVYCLAVYDETSESMHTVSHPFVMDKETGALTFHSPGNRKGDVVLLSKFGMIGEFYLGRMVGGVFEGSDTPDFLHRDTLYLIDETPSRLCTVVRTDTTKRYRYVRYFGPYKGYCNVAEVSFRAPDGSALQGRIIGPERGAYGEWSYFKAMDGDLTTSYGYPTLYDGWVGLDLGVKKAVGSVAYTPRHRDNFVRPGDTYELFVCDGGEWKSAGVKVAQSDSLLYRDIPLDALLLLRNRSRGVDERIFEYENGKQKFW